MPRRWKGDEDQSDLPVLTCRVQRPEPVSTQRTPRLADRGLSRGPVRSYVGGRVMNSEVAPGGGGLLCVSSLPCTPLF